MNIRQISAISFFLLKTIYFSPVGNLSFWILLLLGGVFFIGGDLGKHEVVLLLLLIGISHRLMPAINKIPSHHNDSSSSAISNYTLLLPIENRAFFSAFMLSSTIYVVFLISLCIYIGTISEHPPVVEALSPPHIITANTSTGEPIITVEGIMMVYTIRSASGPYHFKVPLRYSMLFSMLGSEVIINYHKIPDSVFQKFASIPAKKQSPSEVFSLKSNVPQSKYYSIHLHNLNSIHFGRMIMISCFICIFFLIEAIRKYWGTKGSEMNILKWVDFIYYFLYILLCLLLILDILLPESIVKQISIMIATYRIPISIFSFLIIFAAVIRILYTILPQRNHK